MRDLLLDIIKQNSGLVETLRVTGTDTETIIKGCDKDKVLFIDSILKQPIPEFEGEFGITNLSLLNGLLKFPNYMTDDAVLSVKRTNRKTPEGDVTIVEQIEFRNKVTGNSADFRMMNPKLVPKQASIPTIPWLVTVEPSKSKLGEFSQLSGLYSEIDKKFGIKTDNGDLIFFIGDDASSSHRGSMVMATGVKGELKPSVKGELKPSSARWNTQRFLALMRMAGGNAAQLKITTVHGIMSLTVETPFAHYIYHLRADIGA